MWLALALGSFLGGLALTAVGARAKDRARPADPLPPAKIADGRPFRAPSNRSSGLGTVILGVFIMIGGPLVCLALYALDNVTLWRS